MRRTMGRASALFALLLLFPIGISNLSCQEEASGTETSEEGPFRNAPPPPEEYEAVSPRQLRLFEEKFRGTDIILEDVLASVRRSFYAPERAAGLSPDNSVKIRLRLSGLSAFIPKESEVTQALLETPPDAKVTLYGRLVTVNGGRNPYTILLVDRLTDGWKSLKDIQLFPEPPPLEKDYSEVRASEIDQAPEKYEGKLVRFRDRFGGRRRAFYGYEEDLNLSPPDCVKFYLSMAGLNAYAKAEGEAGSLASELSPGTEITVYGRVLGHSQRPIPSGRYILLVDRLESGWGEVAAEVVSENSALREATYRRVNPKRILSFPGQHVGEPVALEIRYAGKSDRSLQYEKDLGFGPANSDKFRAWGHEIAFLAPKPIGASTILEETPRGAFLLVLGRIVEGVNRKSDSLVYVFQVDKVKEVKP